MVGEGDGDALRTGEEAGLGEAVGGEEGKCLPSHPVRASVKIMAQAIYIAFFTKAPSLEKDSCPGGMQGYS